MDPEDQDQDVTTITATTPDGDEVEVQRPDGWIREDDLVESEDWMPASALDDRVERAKKTLKGNLSAELMNSDDFLERVAKVRKSDLKEILGVDQKQPDVDIEELRDEIADELVTPVKDELEEARSEVSALRSESRDSRVARAAAKLGLHPEMLPLVQRYYADMAEYDGDNYREFFIAKEDGDGFRVNPKAKKGEAPYMTIRQDLAAKRASGEFPAWFQSKQRSGIDFDGGEPESEEDIRAAIDAAEADGDFAKAGRLKEQWIQQRS